MQPYEVVASPLTVWVANVGTAFPAINATPSGSWFQLGTSGNKNYADDGITVTHAETVQVFRPAGGTAPRKAFRTDEDFKIGFSLVDLTPEQYAKTLDDATITNTAGPPGHKAFEVLRGLKVKAFALLARGVSPVDESLNAQYEVASCFQSADPAPKYSKGAPAELALEFTAIEATAGVLTTLRLQTS
jgi:hypothetical protein